MWSRKDVKRKGKERFKANYWMCVVVALILTVLAGGTGAFSGGRGASTGFQRSQEVVQDGKKHTSISDTLKKGVIGEGNTSDSSKDTGKSDNSVNNRSGSTSSSSVNSTEKSDDNNGISKGALLAILGIAGIVGLILTAIAIVWDVFLVNPLEMGGNTFFLKNHSTDSKIGNILFAFENNYKNIVKILFFRDLYLVLWTFLFIIPGIIKGYEYRMIPYLLAENPNMTKEEAFAESKRMMTGQKWNAFVLDLSFMGWILLSIFTCGILSIFYVNPYIYSTNAALYLALKGDEPNEEEVFYQKEIVSQ